MSAKQTIWKRMFGRGEAPSKTRAYDGASKARRVEDWLGSHASANAELDASLSTLRARSRDLIRNDPHATKAIAELTASLVGSGIIPRANTGDEALDAAIDAAFEVWSETCETSGQMDFIGCQVLAARSFFESGEVLVRRRLRRPEDGAGLFQLQVLESDMLDSGKNAPLSGGARIIQGVELSPLDKRQAYWLFPSHPGESVLINRADYSSQRVPADGVAHIYETLRPGQVRGVPWLHSVIIKLHDLGDYDDAELVRKKIEAAVVAMVIAADDENEESITPLVEDSDGNQVESFEPGMIGVARGAKDVKFSNPATVGGYAEYRRTQLQSVAAGSRTTYELLSGDLSAVNFSSIRAGQIAFRRIMRQVQQTVFVYLFCRQVWQWFIDGLILTGEIPDAPNAYKVRWFPPRLEEVDRLREAQADQIELTTGVSSLSDIVAARGGDPEAHIEALAKTLKQLQALGVRLPVGPAVASADGSFPMDAKPDASGKEDEKDTANG